MVARQYFLTEEEELRLQKGLQASIAVPLLDSIEDFIWESVFCYTKKIPYVDPFTNIRSKKLYDVVDKVKKIGWSAKALQWTLTPGGEFEIVIQRADVFKKANELGFPGLNMDSDPNVIGEALLKHWQNKINSDAIDQNVIDKRICILLKNKACTKFAYVEEDIAIYQKDELEWNWADSKRAGLKAILKSNGRCVYKWYHGQTQFFERFKFSNNPTIYNIPLKRMSLEEFIDVIYSRL